MSVGYRRSANDASHRGPDGDSEVDGVNPWARGGSMSTDWIYEPLPARAGTKRSSSGPPWGPLALAAVVAVTAVAGVIAGVSLRPLRTAPPEPAVGIGELRAAVSASRSDGGGRADGRSGLVPVGTSADTVVGSITWSRVDGARRRCRLA